MHSWALQWMAGRGGGQGSEPRIPTQAGVWTALSHRSWGKVLGKPHLATCGLGWLLTPCRGSTSVTDESKIKQEITKLGRGLQGAIRHGADSPNREFDDWGGIGGPQTEFPLKCTVVLFFLFFFSFKL